jgi:hypothetical protein
MQGGDASTDTRGTLVWSASVVDKPNTKIAVSDLDKLEELLEQAPAHRDTAISKRQAIGRLAPKLYALRAKGYSWNGVARWLTEHGLAVTAAVLTGYLRYTPPHAAIAAARPAKARRQRSATAPAIVSAPAASTEQAALARVATPPAPSGPRAAIKNTPALKGDHGARRSEFAVRPDSDEL